MGSEARMMEASRSHRRPRAEDLRVPRQGRQPCPPRHQRHDPRLGRPRYRDRTGTVFVMNMRNRIKGDHQVENHVVIYEPDRAIGWAPAEPGCEPAGHTWTWRLTPFADNRTLVTETYDDLPPAARTPGVWGQVLGSGGR